MRYHYSMKDLRAIIIVCVSLLLIAGMASLTFLNRGKTDDTVSITGMGKLDFESDHIVWNVQFTEEDKVLARAYEATETAKAKVLDFFAKAGIKPDEVILQPIEITKSYRDIRNAKGEVVDQEFDAYLLTQGFTVDSHEVDKVTTLTGTISDLIRQGIEIVSTPPAYFYTKLADLKLKLIALAAQDAKARATEMVANSNVALGRLRSSSLGVFQIIGVNDSTDNSSWEGNFDTRSRFKTATVTVHAYYEIR